MREIKFRAWVVNTQSYEYMDSLYWFEENMIRTVPGEALIENVVIEQLTGIKDKNGKEIYEGDIVKAESVWFSDATPYLEEVSYQEDGALFLPFGYSDYALSSDDIEVIGNIHENGGLLNEKMV